MESLKNTTLSLTFFLLINIVCVTCTNKELESCLTEISLEFQNVTPIEDFSHGLFHISGGQYSKNTDELSEVVKGYYMDIFNVLLNTNLPSLPIPQYFCFTKYGTDGEDCKSKIASIGCEGDVDGEDCIRHIYLNWRHTSEPGEVPGTEYLSEKQLHNAISGGSDNFHGLSDGKLSEGFSDDKLLEDFNSENEEGQNDLYDARSAAYGIGHVSYEDLCREFVRRESVPKPYIKYYALSLYKKIKKLGIVNFNTREKYCKEYLKQKKKSRTGRR